MIDIHIHSIYSDGDKTIAEILRMCEEKNLQYISITDHDTCKQYEDKAMQDNTIFHGKIIKGTELHATFHQRTIEILAYQIDTKKIEEWLKIYYSDEQLKKQQQIGRKRLFDLCDQHGLVYDKSEIEQPKKPTDFVEQPIYKEVMKHPENHAILGEFAQSFSIFYRKGISNPNSSYYMHLDEFKPTAKEVCQIIHQTGGKAFLAHPFEYKIPNTIQFIEDLREEADFDGIECYHPSATIQQQKILVDYAKTNQLYVSGGSDYHGKTKPDIEIGVGRGDLIIPQEILEWL